MIGLILLSLGITTMIAFLIAFGFYFVQPHLAYAIFWITFGLQWVIMEPINRILKNRALKQEGKTFDKLTKYEEAVGKQSVSLECEYCSEPNAVKIDLSKQNNFVCAKCGNANNVILQFSTARVTNPLDTIEPVNPTEIIDELKHMEEEND